MFSVKSEAINAFLEASKNNHPDEFICFLSGNIKQETVEEIVVLPAEFGKNYSMIRTHLIPFDSSYVGTAHSHPSGSNWPSKEDLQTFSRTGQIHLIASYPYAVENIQAFTNKGKNTQIKII